MSLTKQEQSTVDEAVENVKQLCRKNYQDGFNAGFARGFEQGVKACIVESMHPSDVLHKLA